MLRAVLAVIAGFLALAVSVFICFSIAYYSMGPERAYEPGTFKVSTLWLVFAVPINFIVAMIGGWVCRAIARRPGPAWALAIIVALLGAVEATMLTLNPRASAERSGEVAMMDAMTEAVQPTWVAWLTPALGFVGILLGGSALGNTSQPDEW